MVSLKDYLGEEGLANPDRVLAFCSLWYEKLDETMGSADRQDFLFRQRDLWLFANKGKAEKLLQKVTLYWAAYSEHSPIIRGMRGEI